MTIHHGANTWQADGRGNEKIPCPPEVERTKAAVVEERFLTSQNKKPKVAPDEWHMRYMVPLPLTMLWMEMPIPTHHNGSRVYWPRLAAPNYDKLELLQQLQNGEGATMDWEQISRIEDQQSNYGVYWGLSVTPQCL